MHNRLAAQPMHSFRSFARGIRIATDRTTDPTRTKSAKARSISRRAARSAKSCR